MAALHRRRLLASIASGLTVGLAGCGGDGTGTGTATDGDATPRTESPRDQPGTSPSTPTGTPADAARLRLAHMSPDAPDLVVSVDGDVVPANLGVPFGRVGEYAAVPAGTRRLSVAPRDETSVLVDRAVTLDPTAYTFVAAGEVVDDEPAFRVFPLVDDDAPGEGTARLRVVHVSPDAGQIDVTAAGGDVRVPGLGFADSDDLLVEAGDYTVRVRPGGTDGADVVHERELSLAGGTVATVFATGYVDVEFASDASFDLAVVRDTPS